LGRAVAPERFSPAVRDAMRAVLTESPYRRNAARLRDKLAALPDP